MIGMDQYTPSMAMQSPCVTDSDRNGILLAVIKLSKSAVGILRLARHDAQECRLQSLHQVPDTVPHVVLLLPAHVPIWKC
jgi:hypothetical protein